MSTDTNPPPDAPTLAPAPAPSRRRLALVVCIAPAAWIVSLNAGSALVPYSCDRGTEVWLHVRSVSMLLVAAVGLVLTRRLVTGAPRETDRFIARIGWWVGLISTAAIVAEGALAVALGPCP